MHQPAKNTFSRLLIVPALLFFAFPGISQTSRKSSTDPRYVGDFPQVASVRLNMSKVDLGFELRNASNKQTVKYLPNSQGNIGLGVTYRKTMLEVAFRLPMSDGRKAIYGNTSTFNLTATSFGRKIGYEIGVQSYKGFYVSNPSDFQGSWRGLNEFPQRPDARFTNVGGSVFYVFNNQRFSYPAAFTQTERQLQNAGSPILLASLYYQNLKSDSTLYPAPQPFRDGLAFERGKFLILSIAPGYAYTIVVNENFYISPSFSFGLNFQRNGYYLDKESRSDWTVGSKVNAKVAAGYYGEQFFAGLAVTADTHGMELQNVKLNTNMARYKVFVGYRFDRFFGKKVKIPLLDPQ